MGATMQYPMLNYLWHGVYGAAGTESTLGIMLSSTVVFNFGIGVFMYTIGPLLSTSFSADITYYNSLLSAVIGITSADLPANFFYAGAAQFGNSSFTLLSYSVNSVMYMGLSPDFVVPPEYSAYSMRPAYGGKP